MSTEYLGKEGDSEIRKGHDKLQCYYFEEHNSTGTQLPHQGGFPTGLRGWMGISDRHLGAQTRKGRFFDGPTPQTQGVREWFRS